MLFCEENIYSVLHCVSDQDGVNGCSDQRIRTPDGYFAGATIEAASGGTYNIVRVGHYFDRDRVRERCPVFSYA